MAGGFTFKLLDGGASRMLRALEKASQDLAPAFAVIGSRIASRVRLCFKLGIDPWGSPWAKLKFRKGQPLKDTGRLRSSVVSKPDSTGVTVGTNLIQAPVHQFGATIVPVKAKRLVFPGPGGGLIFAKKVVIPARPFLPLQGNQVVLPAEWSASVVSALRTYFKKAAEV